MDIPPKGADDLLVWAANFAHHLVLHPQACGVDPADAAEFQGMYDAYAAALAAVKVPESRTRVSVAEKDTARDILRRRARELIRIVRAHRGFGAEQAAALNLPLRAAPVARLSPPATAPQLHLRPQNSLRNSLRILDAVNPQRRARPHGVIGCEVWVKIGGERPRSIEECRYHGLATRSHGTLSFPAGSGNQTCWAIGRWINQRGEAGPPSIVASATIAA